MPLSPRRRGTGGSASDLPAAWSLEDWEVLRAVFLDLAPVGPVLVPCGAGDAALDLLAMGAEEVIAVAPHEGSLALAELKLAAARTFPVWNLRSLLGLDAFGRRVFLYHYIRDRKVEGRSAPPPALSPRARRWWDGHEAEIRTGLAESGQRERALGEFRRHLRRLGLERRVEAALAGAEPLGGRRWRVACRLGLPAVAPGTPVAALRARLEALAARPDHGGPALRRLLTGTGGDDEADHPYLRTSGHALLAERGEALRLEASELAAALATLPDDSLGGVSLGLAWEREGSDLDELLAEAGRILRPGARLLVRCAQAEHPAALIRDAVTRTSGLALDEACTTALDSRDRHPLSLALGVAVRRS